MFAFAVAFCFRFSEAQLFLQYRSRKLLAAGNRIGNNARNSANTRTFNDIGIIIFEAREYRRNYCVTLERSPQQRPA